MNEERLVATIAAQLSLATCAALDALIQTAPDEENEAYQAPIFPVRSELASLRAYVKKVIGKPALLYKLAKAANVIDLRL